MSIEYDCYNSCHQINKTLQLLLTQGSKSNTACRNAGVQCLEKANKMHTCLIDFVQIFNGTDSKQMISTNSTN